MCFHVLKFSILSFFIFINTIYRKHSYDLRKLNVKNIHFILINIIGSCIEQEKVNSKLPQTQDKKKYPIPNQTKQSHLDCLKTMRMQVCKQEYFSGHILIPVK